MGYAYQFDEKANLLVVRFWGRIEKEEEAEAVARPLSDPRIRSNPRVLVDRTRARVATRPAEMESLMDLVGGEIEPLGKPRVAVVVSADMDYGMLRMFEMRSDSRLNHEFCVFRDMDEACKWLEIELSSVDWPEIDEEG